MGEPVFKLTVDNEIFFGLFALIAVLVICKTVVTVVKSRK